MTRPRTLSELAEYRSTGCEVCNPHPYLGHPDWCNCDHCGCRKSSHCGTAPDDDPSALDRGDQ